MPPEVSPSATEHNQKNGRNENDDWRKILVALLFLLLSFSCIFCSSQTALWAINRARIDAGMRSLLSADYDSNPAIALAPLSDEIAAEAARDEAALLPNQTPLIQGVPIAVLPNPVPTPIPTPTFVPTPPPSTSPSPVAPPPTVDGPTAPAPTAPLPSTPVAPTTTAAPPPTALPTGTVLPPPPTPPSSPTAPPPTLPPTSVPPTSRPPTATPITPQVAFSTAAFAADEAEGAAVITAALSAATTQMVTVDYTTTDITAMAISDYVALSDTLTFPAGQSILTFSVVITDDILTNEFDEDLRLILSNPLNATLGTTNPVTLTITDDDGQPAVSFITPDFSVNENAGPATITTTLDAPSALTVTVAYNSSDVTATAGDDYTAVSDSLTFAPGQTSLTFTVPITDDTLSNELTEDVELALSNPTDALLGASNPATLTITDDDGQPNVEFSRTTYQVDENAGPATITAILDAPSALTVTVAYTSSDITATAGDDYTAVSDSLTFAPGQTSLTFTVPITDDGLTNESTEDVALALSNPTGALLGASNPAMLTITDDDGQPTVSFISPDFSVNEGDDGGTGTIPAPILVGISAPSAVPVTVTYATADGSATTAGGDYAAATGLLVFNPGTTTRQLFSVSVLSDTLDEQPSETIQLDLSAPVSAALGVANATLTVIDDDPVSTGSTCIGGTSPITEPNVGAPNGLTFSISCGSEVVVDLGGTPAGTNGNEDYDLVYYELGQSDPPTSTSFIFMDWLVLQVGQTTAGPWFTVFYWGDDVVDTNSNIGPTYGGDGNGEINNEVIPTTAMYGTSPYTTGITIDIDARAPVGTYQYVRLYAPGGPPSPSGGGGPLDAPNIDAIEVPAIPIPP